jgi:hypothetical protein
MYENVTVKLIEMSKRGQEVKEKKKNYFGSLYCKVLYKEKKYCSKETMVVFLKYLQTVYPEHFDTLCKAELSHPQRS